MCLRHRPQTRVGKDVRNMFLNVGVLIDPRAQSNHSV